MSSVKEQEETLRPPTATEETIANEIEELFSGAACTVDQLLARSGSVGLLLISLRELSTIEARFGAGARAQVVGKVERIVQEVVGKEMTSHDRISRSSDAEDELFVQFFRPPVDREFFSRTLPALSRSLRKVLAERHQQLAFPYLRPGPRLGVGWGVAPYNGTIRASRTIMLALEQARQDARLYAEQKEFEEWRDLATMVIYENIQPVFEPIVHLRSRSIFGVEALSRGPAGSQWEAPTYLFSVAKKAGLLFELDALCRRVALREMAGRVPRDANVFLNCMPSALLDPAFHGPKLVETLESCGLRPQQIILEINEQESIQNAELFHKAVHHYRQVGIRIALDDVGSGYASLSTVLDARPDIVKIDLAIIRSVDKDSARAELVSTIVRLARRIGATCVAEGVETKEELEAVEKLGVDYVQGYLFSRAVPLEHALDPGLLSKGFSSV